MSDKYYEAVESFADKYSSVKGVIRAEPDDFGADVIVILFDDERYPSLEMPKTFEGYEVCPVGVYSLQETYETLVDMSMLNEPSIWDVDYKVPLKDSLDNIEKIIHEYEEKLENSKEDSLLKIRNSLQWIIQNNPVENGTNQ